MLQTVYEPVAIVQKSGMIEPPVELSGTIQGNTGVIKTWK